jgi:peptidoglycan/LPS O-acetylase OafA/YrhL
MGPIRKIPATPGCLQQTAPAGKRPRPDLTRHGAASGEIRAVTGLRGIAALLVAGYHVTAWGLQAPKPLSPLLRHGYLGVDIFFVLSGFVMALTYGPQLVDGGFRYGQFLQRRLRRIYPLYAMCVITDFALVHSGVLPPFGPQAGSAGRLAVDLLLLQCLGAGASLLPVAWSLSTEWMAYLAFPVLAGATLTRGARLAMLASCGWLLVLWGLCLIPYHGGDGFTLRAALHHPLDHIVMANPYPVLRCLAGFCLGLFAWRAGRSTRAAILGQPVAGSVLAGLCVVLLCTPAADYLIDAASALLLLSLMKAGAAPAAGAARWLAASPVHWLGTISYSLYLTHLPLWQALHPWLERQGAPNLCLLAPAIGLAALVYYAVELPARRLAHVGIGRHVVRPG